MANVTFDGPNKCIDINPLATSISVKSDIYSEWKRWVLQEDNSKYLQAIRSIGGDPISGGLYAGDIYFLMNGWKVCVYGSVDVNGVIYSDDGSSPYDVEPGTFLVTGIVSNLVQTVGTGSDLWNQAMDGVYTAGDILKILAAIAGGKASGCPANPVFRNLSDNKDVVTGTADSAGNRTGATYNP